MGDLRKKTFTPTIQLDFLPCKTFVNAIWFFEGGNSERKQLAGWIPHTHTQKNQTQQPKKLTFFYVYPVFLYKNKCYIPIKY